MKVAMHNWMRPEPIETTITRLGRSGYDGIEISGEPALYDSDAVKRQLDDNNLECWGSVTPMTGGRDLVHEDYYVRMASVQYVKDCLSLVASLGGSILTIVPSTVGKVVPMASPEEEWEWAVNGLKECQAHAEEVGVRIGVEPLNRFETYFLNRHDQALALAKEVGPDCGVCIDVFHMNIEEQDMYQAIRNCKGRLADFHVADNNRMACGMGHCDWGKIIGTLKEIGYDGALTVEFVAPVDRTPANPYPNAIEKGPVNLTADELKFIEDHGSSTLSDEFYTWLVSETSKTLRKYM
jgi:D-psicose/D-tagatose/L-ribulose 3-epimerase